MTYACDVQGCPNPVAVLVTHLNTGQTDASCDDDLPILLIGQLATWADVDPQKLYDAVQRHIAKVQAAAAKAASAAAPPAPEDPDVLPPVCDTCGRHLGSSASPCDDCPDRQPAAAGRADQ